MREPIWLRPAGNSGSFDVKTAKRSCGAMVMRPGAFCSHEALKGESVCAEHKRCFTISDAEREVVQAAEMWMVEMAAPFETSSAARLTGLEHQLIDALVKLREARGE